MKYLKVKMETLGSLGRVEFSELLGIKRATLNRWEKEGKLVAIKVEGEKKVKYTMQHIAIVKGWGDSYSERLDLLGF